MPVVLFLLYVLAIQYLLCLCNGIILISKNVQYGINHGCCCWLVFISTICTSTDIVVSNMPFFVPKIAISTTCFDVVLLQFLSLHTNCLWLRSKLSGNCNVLPMQAGRWQHQWHVANMTDVMSHQHAFLLHHDTQQKQQNMSPRSLLGDMFFVMSQRATCHDILQT